MGTMPSSSRALGMRRAVSATGVPRMAQEGPAFNRRLCLKGTTRALNQVRGSSAGHGLARNVAASCAANLERADMVIPVPPAELVLGFESLEQELARSMGTQSAANLADTLLATMKALRKTPKAKVKEFLASGALADAWAQAQSLFPTMSASALSKMLEAAAHAKDLKALDKASSVHTVELIEDELAKCLHKAQHAVVTQICVSLSHLKWCPSMELQAEITKFISMKVQRFDVHELVSLLASMNKVPRMQLKKYLLSQCATHIIANRAELSGSQVSEVLVVFAFCNFRPRANDLLMLEEQFEHTSMQPGEVNLNALLRLLKSYAKLGLRLPDDWLAVLGAYLAPGQTTRRRLKPKPAANMVFYLARMKQYPGDAVLDSLCECIEQSVAAIPIKLLPRVAWGLGKLQYRPSSDFADKVGGQASRGMHALTASEISQLFYGLALLDATPNELLVARTVPCVLERQAEFSLRNMATLLWSLTVLQVWDSEDARAGLESLWRGLEETQDIHGGWGLNVRAKHALHSAAMCTLRETAGSDFAVAIPDSFAGGLEFAEASKEEQPVSEVQREVATLFEDLGTRCVTGDGFDRAAAADESNTPSDSLLCADFYLPDLGLAVEVDGPSHFFVNTLEETGKTRFRNRVHATKGWAVASVPYFEWEQLEGQDVKMAYLADLVGVSGGDRSAEGSAGEEAGDMLAAGQ